MNRKGSRAEGRFNLPRGSHDEKTQKMSEDEQTAPKRATSRLMDNINM